MVGVLVRAHHYFSNRRDSSRAGRHAGRASICYRHVREPSVLSPVKRAPRYVPSPLGWRIEGSDHIDLSSICPGDGGTTRLGLTGQRADHPRASGAVRPCSSSRAQRASSKPMCRAPSMASTPSMAPNGRRRAPCHAQRPLQRPNGPTLQRSNGPTACDAQRPLRYGYSRRLLLCALLTAYSRPQPHCFRLCLSFSVACLTSSTALAFAFSVSSYSSLSFLALA